ncbi:hypothetical protein QBC33DRAFT_606665 [Phialemonium atrogriseum]|uniref:Uncharacterized protein n=1 Tax=Phialemonium atrogriseum TaxID=1093897 RepID=A0AAJ0C1S3_9PEZI|nr:uncharacterized protein QBC33DRAFT_606665 [Phialemonium atrogriseum]KAK1768301.1 hypothetical protein QBC33DRAFT_606665 [Phialemonium atrogriseum]
MPALSVATDPASARPGANTNRNRRNTNSRPSSPIRPPISPITPTIPPARLPASSPSNRPPPPLPLPPSNHPTNTTAPPSGPPDPDPSQAQAVGIPPPRAAALRLDDNPDALALRSAISILQLQRARAARDVAALSRARDAALADPAAFVADLCAGRVASAGDPLFPAPSRGGGGAGGGWGGPGEEEEEEDDDDDDDDDDDGDEDDDMEGGGQDSGAEAPHDGASAQQQQPRGQGGNPPSLGREAWRTLPRPQNVVRCPPVNWAQYAVVGESLDKLHAEQQRAPTGGSPAVLGPGGAYEFKAGQQQQQQQVATDAEGDRRGLVGIAAPYTPGRDKLEKKAKGGRK